MYYFEKSSYLMKNKLQKPFFNLQNIASE